MSNKDYNYDPQANEYEYIHKQMGCHACKFADKDKLDKGPCCTYGFGLEFDK